MPQRWLSYWNKKHQVAVDSDPGDDAAIWVPYGDDKLEGGDVVYCVGVRAGDLHLFGRLVVGRIENDDEHNRSVKVWEKLGTETPWRNDRVLPKGAVDALVYRYANGARGRFVSKAGVIQATPFQGRASIRELVGGSEILDRIAEQ
jgi:hypothetical protein